MSAPRARLELVMDELVLRGLEPERAHAVAAALEARLRLLAESSPGPPLSGRVESFRRLPAVEAPAASPAALGDAVARAVWETIAGGGTR
jgi:hypothetical protein